MIRAVDKRPGWTPLEALDALRRVEPARAAEPMVYAGRLDPMAEGLLLVLTGEDRHALPAHLAHDKDYDATFLFGLSSDTHDALGRLTPGRPPDPDACARAVQALRGAHRLPLPAWSAYRVRGRPLHAWASEGRLAEIAVPEREMVVTAVGEARAEGLGARAIAGEVAARIGTVRGAFRQAEALADWAGEAAADRACVRVRVALTLQSGGYVRALAHALGQDLGCGGLLLALRRTRVGPYGLDGAVRLDAHERLAGGVAPV